MILHEPLSVHVFSYGFGFLTWCLSPSGKHPQVLKDITLTFLGQVWICLKMFARSVYDHDGCSNLSSVVFVLCRSRRKTWRKCNGYHHKICLFLVTPRGKSVLPCLLNFHFYAGQSTDQSFLRAWFEDSQHSVSLLRLSFCFSIRICSCYFWRVLRSMHAWIYAHMSRTHVMFGTERFRARGDFRGIYSYFYWTGSQGATWSFPHHGVQVHTTIWQYDLPIPMWTLRLEIHVPIPTYVSCRREFRSQTSDNMQRWKSRGGKSQRGEVKKWEDQRRERVGSKKMQVREKVGKSRFTVFFPMICGSGGSKSNLAKAAGAEPAGQMRDEKVRAIVARSTFPSQKGKTTPASDRFWKLSCRKSARRCGAKHISKSKVSKTFGLRPFLEVEMSKKVHAVVAWSTFPSQNGKSTTCSDHFLTSRCRTSPRRCGAKHISKSKM